LEKAVRLASEVKNDTVLGQALNYLGDSYFYRGDYGIARQQYEKGLQVATRSKSRELLAIARFNLAKLGVVQGRSPSVIPILKKQVEEFDSLGLKARSVRASIYLAEALLATTKPAEAQRELDHAMNRAEKLSLLVELARAHYLLAKASKPTEAAPHYKEAARILQSLATQEGVSHILDRHDLKNIYSVAKSSQSGM
jgi:tetratricopeptide (TPR) repeat protein